MSPQVKYGLCLALSACLCACATVESDKRIVGPPKDWTDQFAPEEAECLDIESTFVNSGERFAGPENVTADAYLSEVVFNRRLPGGHIAKLVRVSADVDSGDLLVTLIGESTREIWFEISCDSGWNVLRFTREGQYLGESVVETEFDQVSFFRIGKSGEFIARVVTKAEFNSMYVFRSKTDAVDWYRFEPDL